MISNDFCYHAHNFYANIRRLDVRVRVRVRTYVRADKCDIIVGGAFALHIKTCKTKRKQFFQGLVVSVCTGMSETGVAFQQRLVSHGKKHNLTLEWEGGKNAPSVSMVRGGAAVIGNIAYFSTSTSKSIYAYDITKDNWFTLPACPQQCFALVVINGLLTAVGGFRSIEPTSCLQSLIEMPSQSGSSILRSWSEKFPRMPTRRGKVAAVCVEDYLIVAGGQLAVVSQIGGVLRRVEIMDTKTLQWFSVCNLPYEITQPSMTVCEDRLYVMGGWVSDRTRSVLSCSLQELVDSRFSSPPLSPTSPTGRIEASLWNQVADIPCYATTAVTLKGSILLGVGGCNEDEEATNEVYCYDKEADEWFVISKMPTARYRAIAIVLPGKKLMVIGGTTNAEGSLIGDGDVANYV